MAGINFSISKGRAIVIAAIVVLLLISTQLWEGKKEDKSIHYLKAIGSCGQPTTIEIYDETGGIDSAAIDGSGVTGGMRYTSKPINTIENQHFKNYVTNISQYIFAKVDAMGMCQQPTSKPTVELTFVYRPAISSGIAPYQLQPLKSQNTKQLDSPWVKLRLDKSPKLNLRAVFFWNERQFLLDQALIFGDKNWDSIPLMPISLETFEEWERKYRYSELDRQSTFIRQLPADIRWLFKYSWVSDCADIGSGESAICGIKTINEEEKRGYLTLNKLLVDLFLKKNKKAVYNNILEIQNIFDVKKYKLFPYTHQLR